MDIFPITKKSDNFGEDLDEIIGFQAVDYKGMVLGRGETEEEAREAALTALYLDESNPSPRKISLGRKLLITKNTVKVGNLAK